MTALRWVPSRKAAIVVSVLSGKTTFAQACADNDLTSEELQGWIDAYRREGQRGLLATHGRYWRPAA